MKDRLVDEFPGLASLEIIYEQHARDCKRCELHRTRKNVVFGVGNSESPDIAFLGEAPGAKEDEQGYPFVGPAGDVLTALITKLGYERLDLYILNVLLCRPPGNRNPLPEEAEACSVFYRSQLKAVSPKVIVCLGSVAAKTLLKKAPSTGLSSLRGKRWWWNRTPVVVTYHPAFLLPGRSPHMKQRVWADMQGVMEMLREMKSGNKVKGVSKAKEFDGRQKKLF